MQSGKLNKLQAGRPSQRTAVHVRELVQDADDMVRLNVIIPKAKHREIKAFALQSDMTMTDLVIKALNEYMSK